MGKIILGLFFGGKSTEHEVSVITALQAYENLDLKKYEVIPVYVSKLGDFYTNPKFLDLKNYKDLEGLILSSSKIILGRRGDQSGFYIPGLLSKFIPFDLAFPALHGSFGEDGCIQGLFEFYQIPYIGFGVMGSAVGMDKITQKAVFQALDLPIGNYIALKRHEWLENSQACLKKVSSFLKFPLFVKPATTGSSIGVGKVKNKDELSFQIEVAATFAEKILIEAAFEDVAEVNCSALGYHRVEASVCEMPKASGEVLSFSDKYQRGEGTKSSRSGLELKGMVSMSRIIPAPISPKLTKTIQEATIKIFQALDGCGVARVDYFVDQKREQYWVNEINTMPGSLSYYLWEPLGIKYSELLDKVIQYNMERAQEQKKTQYTFHSGLLQQMALKGGLKR